MHDENWQGEWIGDRVKIIKRPNRRPYYAQYTDNKGQRHLPSLKTANIKAARKRAHELLSALENMTDARLARVKDTQRVTFGEAAEIYLEECELAEKSRKEDRTRLDIVRKDWEDVPINTITTGHIESWLAKNRNKRQWSKSTRNRYLSAIKQVFKKAFSLDYAMENVASPKRGRKNTRSPIRRRDDRVDGGATRVCQVLRRHTGRHWPTQGRAGAYSLARRRYPKHAADRSDNQKQDL